MADVCPVGGRIPPVSLNIKNPATVRLARELAATTGETVTQAVTVAVRERLDHLRVGAVGAASQRAARIRAISADAARRWVEPYRTGDLARLLYDDLGLPR